MRFITGITGQFYRQFALTIATSTVISAFNSLTLQPGARGACCCGRGRRACSRRCRGRRSWRVGGWAGYAFLGPQLLKLAQAAGLQLDSALRSPLELAANLVGTDRWAAWPAGVVSGVLNRVFGWTFYLFNKAFDASTSLYTRMVGGPACGSASWCSCSTAGCWG